MKDDKTHAVLDDAQGLGHEGRAGSGDHVVLKLWLRMLASTTSNPSLASCLHTAAPMPRAAPVTIAVRWCGFIESSFNG